MQGFGSDNTSYRHGMTGSPEYKVWVDMRQRCSNPNRTNYKFYGGRGISVCDRWGEFEAFIADMGPRPSRQHSIERKDNHGPYSPDNCKWATRSEQLHNYGRNRWIEIDGVKKTIGDWAKEQGIDETLIRFRIKRGASERDAVFLPVQSNIGGKRFNPQLSIMRGAACAS